MARLVRRPGHLRRREVVRVRRVGRGRRARLFGLPAAHGRLAPGAARRGTSPCRSRRTAAGSLGVTELATGPKSRLLPTGAGKPRTVPTGDLACIGCGVVSRRQADPPDRPRAGQGQSACSFSMAPKRKPRADLAGGVSGASCAPFRPTADSRPSRGPIDGAICIRSTAASRRRSRASRPQEDPIGLGRRSRAVRLRPGSPAGPGLSGSISPRASASSGRSWFRSTPPGSARSRRPR